LIITVQKPLEEILELLKPYKRIFIIGCGICCTTSKTGGEEEVKRMAETLGDKVIGYTVVESPCDSRVLRRDLKHHLDKVKSADVILTMCCGCGAQNIEEYTNKPIVPALNTQFLGKVEKIGVFDEKCRECSDCVLGLTGGICPVTLCPKGLLNGPCGGTADGKCEVGGYVRDCVWIKIYKRMKERNQLHIFKKIKPPRDYSLMSKPRSVVVKKHYAKI